MKIMGFFLNRQYHLNSGYQENNRVLVLTIVSTAETDVNSLPKDKIFKDYSKFKALKDDKK